MLRHSTTWEQTYETKPDPAHTYFWGVLSINRGWVPPFGFSIQYVGISARGVPALNPTQRCTFLPFSTLELDFREMFALYYFKLHEMVSWPVLFQLAEALHEDLIFLKEILSSLSLCFSMRIIHFRGSLFSWPNLVLSFVCSSKSLQMPRDGKSIFIAPLTH